MSIYLLPARISLGAKPSERRTGISPSGRLACLGQPSLVKQVRHCGRDCRVIPPTVSISRPKLLRRDKVFPRSAIDMEETFTTERHASRRPRKVNRVQTTQ